MSTRFASQPATDHANILTLFHSGMLHSVRRIGLLVMEVGNARRIYPTASEEVLPPHWCPSSRYWDVHCETNSAHGT
jgi:hypothetical protein